MHSALNLEKKNNKEEENNREIHYRGVANVLYYSSLKQSKMK